MAYRNDKPDRFTRRPQPSEQINRRPTAGRPPLPSRVPGETDIDTDPRFNLVGARGVAPAPRDGSHDRVDSEPDQANDEPGHADGDGPQSDGDLALVAKIAKRMAERHMPDRTGGCRHCGGTYCELFLEALAVLDRRDQAAARRIRAVLQYAGLTPP
ncbi:hypothetical protein ACFHWS_08430 [Micromonospora sp. LOL_013]|uniref:hypothetical protein n=1 Tax=Micromonospora sp. LOL_013 TaxID=3345414 RepID=UPI003A88291C